MESTKTMELGIFGEDILASILSLLPKKTLCRFKCVSKAWQSLLSDRSRISPKTTHAGLLCQSFHAEPPPSISRNLPSIPPSVTPCICRGMPPAPASFGSHYAMTFLRTHNDGTASDLPSLFFFMERSLFIVSTGNGLLLLTNVHPLMHPISFVVYNPVTENAVQVPLLSTHRNPIRIGFACKGHCYEVIRVSHDYGAETLEFDIFSSETGEWRELHCRVPHPSRIYLAISPLRNLQALFFEGAVHWLLGRFILIFQLKEDHFKFIELPDRDDDGFDFAECIWDSEGTLSYCKVCKNNGIQIWMREESQEDTGTWKLKHNAVLTIPTSLGTSSMFELCAFNDDFEIVYLKCSGRLFSYKLETGVLNEVRYSTIEEFSACENICKVFSFWNGPMNSLEQAHG